jgi:AraC family transcriptional regulator, regulatory protein of adaptative response / methylated-DNA-[protein]-cysteine methyltransferase
MSMTESSIRFTFGESSLGQVLVAAGDKGISAILFGKDQSSLRHELMDCLPDARPASKPSDLGEVVKKVIGLIEAPNNHPDLRLDLQGSEFERRVWALLLEIPAGETTSYGTIAKKLGGAATAQEVAAACAANRHAVAIPCHRVLKADGSISGYRWGVARKRALLAREALR